MAASAAAYLDDLRYGFDGIDATDASGEDAKRFWREINWESKYKALVDAQTQRWEKAGPLERIGADALKKLARGGVPPRLRAAVWLRASEGGRLRDAQPKLFEQLSGPAQQLPAETATQIEKDLDRTFAHHAFFRSPAGLAALRATLAAYAARNPVVGYCQSLNFIAATLLLQSSGEPTTAFFTLCGLLEKRLPPDYYTRSLFGAHLDTLVLQRLLDRRMPRLAARLRDHNVDVTVPALSWLLTLFVNALPVQTAMRVLDAVMVEGDKMLFRVALALFKLQQKRLMELEGGALLRAVHDLGKDVFDCEALLSTATGRLRNFSRKEVSELRALFRPKLERYYQEMKALKEQLRAEAEKERAERAARGDLGDEDAADGGGGGAGGGDSDGEEPSTST